MKLLFIYNANSGHLNALLDSVHKIVQPDTYECKLCELTHGVFKEREEWLRFRESEKIPMQFLHKDEFLKKYRSKWLPKYEFPIVLIEHKEGLEIFINSSEFAQLDDVDSLVSEVKKRRDLYKE